MMWFKIFVTVWLSLNSIHKLSLVIDDSYGHLVGLAIRIFVIIGMWFFV